MAYQFLNSSIGNYLEPLIRVSEQPSTNVANKDSTSTVNHVGYLDLESILRLIISKAKEIV